MLFMTREAPVTALLRATMLGRSIPFGTVELR
jgi:hypothetical protein